MSDIKKEIVRMLNELLAEKREARAKARLYRAVLIGLSHRDVAGGCWCGYAIGGPLCPTHSDACEKARKALEMEDFDGRK